MLGGPALKSLPEGIYPTALVGLSLGRWRQSVEPQGVYSPALLGLGRRGRRRHEVKQEQN